MCEGPWSPPPATVSHCLVGSSAGSGKMPSRTGTRTFSDADPRVKEPEAGQDCLHSKSVYLRWDVSLNKEKPSKRTQNQASLLEYHLRFGESPACGYKGPGLQLMASDPTE